MTERFATERFTAAERSRGAVRFTGARVILPHGVETTEVTLDGDRIAAVGEPAGAARDIDAAGLVLAPALVDLHGDAFERQVSPRPDVYFPLDAAILDTDRQLAANGIATAYHALTLSWEPGLRSVQRGEAFVDALDALAPRLTVDNRVQLRWETFADAAEPLILRALAGPRAPSLAFNDHTSMALRAFDVPLQARAFEQSPDFATVPLDDPRLRGRLAKQAGRAGLAIEAYLSLLAQVWARRPAIPAAIARIAEAGRAAGAPMLSHDDSQAETRDHYRRLGARIAEFPMSAAVAASARAAGDFIVFGAPNAVRGGSHIGSPSAGDMVEAGLCDALASDYFHPAMLAAVARLHEERRAPLAALWGLVSSGPAAASGLTDRGRIEPGLRADLVLVDWPEGATPAAKLTLSGGRVAYRAGGAPG